MFTGVIKGVGPRYCPSIEDKINRFAGKDEPPDLPRARRPDAPTRSIRTASRPACRSTCSSSWCARSAAWSTRTSCAPATRSSTTTSIRATCKRLARDEGDRGPVLRRADQRHDRLRRGRGAGPARRHQRRRCERCEREPLVPAARRGVPRRAGRRPDHARRVRAVPDVHQPRRVPAAAARGQRRPAPDRDRAQARLGRRRALGRRSAASATRSPRETERVSKSIQYVSAGFRRNDRARVLAYELLRRPDVTYRMLSLPAPVRRSACRGRAGRDPGEVRGLHRAPARGSRAARGAQRRARCRPTSTTRGARPVGRSAAEAEPPPARKRSARRRASPGITPAAISLLLVHLKRGFRRARQKERHDAGARRSTAGSRNCALALAGERARAAARLPRAAREVEPHLQPDRDPRAARDGHAPRARFARGAAASGASSRGRARLADVGSGAGLARHSARDRAARAGASRLPSRATRRRASCARRRSSSRLSNVEVHEGRVEDVAPAAAASTS